VQLKKNLAADGALVLTTVVWGTTFFMAKDILAHWSPLAYMTFRFVVGAVLLVAMFWRQFASASREARRAGATLGVLMGVGFALQAAGQVYTTASKSAFVTGLTTPLVPFVAYAILRARPGVENLVGIVLASAGGALILAPQGQGSINFGDLLTLVSTVAFALHITLLSVYARRYDARQLTVLQITSTAALVFAAWLVFRACGVVFDRASLPDLVARESAPLVWSARIVWQLAYLSTVATVGSFLLWTWGQARSSATHAAIIFSLEPVFATAFAVAFIGHSEWLGTRGFVGAGLVFAGIIASELRWKTRKSGKLEDDDDEVVAYARRTAGEVEN
jgi:drug/metabolite transporter (DMT)-like permease